MMWKQRRVTSVPNLATPIAMRAYVKQFILFGGRTNASCIKCANCSFGYGWPFVGGSEEFYAILHEEPGYPVWRWEYDVAIEHSSRTKPLDGEQTFRWLDIGAGVGKLLEGLPSGWQPFAIEGSGTTRSVLEKKGIQTFKDSADAVATHAGRFSVISLFQVLEHLSDFKKVLSDCRQLIAPGGRLVISVPDGDTMLEQERVVGCADMPPNHLGKWTLSSLSLALRKAGFEVDVSMSEKPSLWTLQGALHLRVLADARNPRSLASQVYRIRNRALRIALLPAPALIAMLKLLPQWRFLLKSGCFMVVAKPT